MRNLTIIFTSGVTAHMLVYWTHLYVKASASSVMVLMSPVAAVIGA